MSKYVRVMDGLKSNASGEEFKLDEVIIPDDAEVINVDEEKGIYRANKIIVTNPRNITEDMVINIYKKSTLSINRYFQCIYCLLFRKYINASRILLMI